MGLEGWKKGGSFGFTVSGSGIGKFFPDCREFFKWHILRVADFAQKPLFVRYQGLDRFVQIIDHIFGNNQRTVAIGVDQIAGLDAKPERVYWQIKVENMDECVAWADATGENLIAGRQHIEVSHQAIREGAGQTEGAM